MAPVDSRRKNVNWNVCQPDGTVWPSEHALKAVLATLMDIRGEVQQLNALLSCGNFQRIPQTLRTISRNTSGLRKRSGGS